MGYKKGIRSYPANKSSSFLLPHWLKDIPIKIRYLKKRSEHKLGVEIDGGLLSDFWESKRIMDRDIEPFTKFFRINFEVLHGLSSTGKSLVFYIGTYIGMDSIDIRLNAKDLMRSLGYDSPTRIYTAIVELLEKNIIEKGEGSDIYNINIRFLFNGSRDKYLVSNQKKEGR